MAATDPAPLELQNRFFRSAPGSGRRAALWALLLFVVVTVVTGLVLNRVFPLEEIDWGKVSRHAWRSIARDIWDLVFFIAAVLASLAQIVYIKRAQRLERLILTDTEIRYQSALPKVLQFLLPAWSAKWSEVTQAYFRKKRGLYGPTAIELVLVTYRGEKRKLRPYFWVDPARKEQENPWWAVHKIYSMKTVEMRRAILDLPVVRFVGACLNRFEPESSWDKIEFPYALETNRSTVVAMLLLPVLMTYALVDFVLNEETYASQPPYGFLVLLGVIVALIAGRWLRGGNVPNAERVGLAIVLGATFGVAFYPGLLRINQLTDGVGLQTYVYQLQRDGTLAPLQKGPPDLIFPRYADYWSAFSVGSLHEFRLRKGGLGFYQVDMAPINEAMREYFLSQPRENRHAIRGEKANVLYAAGIASRR